MLDFFKKKVTETVFNTNHEHASTSASYPLDLRVGSRLNIVNNYHLLYDSFFKTDKQGYSVTAIGNFDVHESTFYRFYLNDFVELVPAPTFLQIITNKEDITEIQEIRVFSLLETIYPSTTASWNRWIKMEGCTIGLMDFAHAGRAFTRLDSWGDAEADWIPPVRPRGGKEVIEGNLKISGLRHESMLYGRWLSDESQKAEYLLVSSIDVINKSGSVTVSGIGIFGGIDLDVSEISVLY